MLPAFLLPSYKQYKTDSDAVATWLANTALRCGYPDNLLGSIASSQQTYTKQGRARNIARDAARKDSPSYQSNESKSQTQTASKNPKYLLTTKDFTSLAEWIVNRKNPQIEVPASFVSVLDRAILVRKQHHKWWNSQNDQSDDNTGKEKHANEGHGYFIETLKSVREILRPRMPAEFLKDPITLSTEEARSSTEPANSQSMNLFENLSIEEPSHDFLNTEPVTSQQKPASTALVQYTANKGSDIVEVLLAVHCLLGDFDNIRRYIQRVWKGYKRGVVNLIAASITTNTAIDFAKRLEEDFNETFPGHTDFSKHFDLLYNSLCLAAGQDPRHTDFVFAVYDDAEVMLLPAWMFMKAFIQLIESKSLPFRGELHEMRSDRASMSSTDKFYDDMPFLLGILEDFCILQACSRKPPVEDEMSRGMLELIKEKFENLRVWLAFAAQILLDIHHILGEKTDNGFHDLVQSARFVETNIQHVLKFHENLRVDTWPKSDDRYLTQILDDIKDWVKTDAIEKSRTKMDNARRKMEKRPQISEDQPERFLLLKHHPLWCGLLSYNLMARAQYEGIAFANAWGSIISCAHLYNAVRQEKLISNIWPDMNLAFLAHQTEEIFIGDFPRGLDDYPKRFTMAMGGSARNFAKNQRLNRSNRFLMSEAGPRCLNEISPVSGMFRARYCASGYEGRVDLSLDDLDVILEKYADRDDDIDSEDFGEWTTPKIKINTQGKTGQDTSAKAEQASKPPRSSQTRPRSAAAGGHPIKLLNALLNAIQSERVELAFDHFRLHVFSLRLLRAVKEAVDGDLRRINGPDYFKAENQLPFVVEYIFMAGAVRSKGAGMIVPKKNDVSRKLLVKAADVMTRMLETHGGRIEVMMLEKRLEKEIEMPDVLDAR